MQYKGFTCGTCFFDEKPNLTNNHWRVLLYMRGDCTYKDSLKGFVDKKDIEKYIIEILNEVEE